MEQGRSRGDRTGRISTRWRGALLVPALVAGLLSSPAGAADRTQVDDVVPGDQAAAAAVTMPDYRPLAPTRVADTRPGRYTVDGLSAGGGAVTPGSPLVLTLGGRGGVPATGVAAVALNVAVTGSQGPGFATVHPNGEARPTASNVNYAGNDTVANSVVAKLGTGNRVVIYSSAPAHVIVDLSGYFTTGGIEAVTPARIADTRPGRVTDDGLFAGGGAISPGTSLQLQVTGRGDVPSSGVTAVALNVAATAPTGEGYLTVYPSGTSRPNASNVNFLPNQSVANSVVAKVGADGKVIVYNSNKLVHVVVDLAGYFTASSGYVPLNPARFSDTRANRTAVAAPSRAPGRTSAGIGAIGRAAANGDQIDILISGRGGVPLTDTGAVVLNVAVTQPNAGGHLTVFPMDSPMPTASSVNFAAGRSVPNLVIAKVGRGGGVSIVSSVPASHVVVDVMGYFPGPSSADQPGEYSASARDELGMPIAYDRCYSIPYAINPANGQTDWVQDVHDAFTTLEAATGIDFVPLPNTTEVPTDPRFDGDYLLVAFTTEAVIPALAGSVVGWGGSVYGWGYNPVRVLPEQFFHGFAYIDSSVSMPAGYGTGLTFGKVILHELGHVVGLGHVANTDELMNASVITRAGGFGAGDQSGLDLLYKTQGCPGSPATFGDALRSGEGKPVPAGTDLQIVTSADHHPEAHGH